MRGGNFMQAKGTRIKKSCKKEGKEKKSRAPANKDLEHVCPSIWVVLLSRWIHKRIYPFCNGCPY